MARPEVLMTRVAYGERDSSRASRRWRMEWRFIAGFRIAALAKLVLTVWRHRGPAKGRIWVEMIVTSPGFGGIAREDCCGSASCRAERPFR